jgi:hypothetical protein
MWELVLLISLTGWWECFYGVKIFFIGISLIVIHYSVFMYIQPNTLII